MSDREIEAIILEEKNKRIELLEKSLKQTIDLIEYYHGFKNLLTDRQKHTFLSAFIYRLNKIRLNEPFTTLEGNLDDLMNYLENCEFQNRERG